MMCGAVIGRRQTVRRWEPLDWRIGFSWQFQFISVFVQQFLRFTVIRVYDDSEKPRARSNNVTKRFLVFSELSDVDQVCVSRIAEHRNYIRENCQHSSTPNLLPSQSSGDKPRSQ